MNAKKKKKSRCPIAQQQANEYNIISRNDFGTHCTACFHSFVNNRSHRQQLNTQTPPKTIRAPVIKNNSRRFQQ